MLIELRIGEVSGFDLSALNAYCWYPHPERIELSRIPHRALSAPFAVQRLDLQARLDAAQGRQADGPAAAEERGSSSPWELDASLTVPVTADGHWNAVAFWFAAETAPGALVASYSVAPAPAARVAASWAQAVQYIDGLPVRLGAQVELRVRQDRGQYVFTSQPAQCRWVAARPPAACAQRPQRTWSGAWGRAVASPPA